MYQYKLKKNEIGYDIIIYLSSDSEFASEFKPKSKDEKKLNNRLQSIYNQIKKKHPKLFITSFKIMLGGLLLATIPIAANEVQAETTSSYNTIQMSNLTYTTKQNDSLWSIASNYNISVDELKRANNLTSDLIPVGKQLIIPSGNLSSIQMSVKYTVQANDSLWTIANKYNVSVDYLRKANNLRSDMLQIGDVLQIPASSTIIPAREYTVQPNDSLWAIANRYNVSVDSLRQVNNLRSDMLQIGDVLQIPTSTTIPTRVYTVQPNDSLWTIATKYNVSVDSLRQSNNLRSDMLQIGDVLQIPTPTAIPTREYIVQANDSLWAIANRYNVSVDALRQANNLRSDMLQIGDILQIPASSETTTPIQTTEYIVQPNDSLWIIANRYNVSVDALRQANNLRSDMLKIGDRLQIPSSQTTTPNQTSVYTVQPNDSLWIIANRYNVSVDSLKQTNNLRSDSLSIGQRLIIPNTNQLAFGTRDVLYRVKSGDTIDSIARSFNISSERLIQANNLSSRNIINNQALIIPLSNVSYKTTIDPTIYYVKSGDDLWKISKQFAVSAESIKQASNLRSDSLSIGQKLIIPTTIASTEYNRTTLEWMIEAQYNMKPDSVFHDVTVQTRELWSKATKDQIRFYTNPENFANDPILKYQFMELNYHSGISNAQLNTILNNKGVLHGQGSTFNQAAANHNVSQAYLVAHAFLETGNGTTQLARGIRVSQVDGKAVTPRVVYNMFGIGAVDTNSNKYGAEYAYKQGWFSVESAISGGAKWISENYINHPTYKQNTLYKMRYNPSAPGVHQYSTDVAWAYHQTFNIYNIVSGFPENIFRFDIPTYNRYYKV